MSNNGIDRQGKRFGIVRESTFFRKTSLHVQLLSIQFSPSPVLILSMFGSDTNTGRWLSKIIV